MSVEAQSDSAAPVIVVGGGQAAAELAVQLRQNGHDGRIQLVCDEPHLPYQRPPLSKSYLSGDLAVQDLRLKSPMVFDKLSIETLTGVRALSIDRANKVLRTSANDLPYSKLALATGGTPRRVSAPGADLDNIFYLRTIADSDAIRPNVKAGRRMVILGAGYIGLEVAAVARKAGMDVTVIEAASRVLARTMPEPMSSFYEAVHGSAGVRIVTDTMVSAFEPKAGTAEVGRVIASDGRAWNADVVIVGIGLVANAGLASDAGLAVENGIVVDAFARTSDPDIVAAGDCTAHAEFAPDRLIRLESVSNAIEQARTAALTLCGKPRAYAAIPWFWSDQYDLKLQTVGLCGGHDRMVVRGAMDKRAFIAFYLREGKLIAADAVNRPQEFAAARQLMAKGLSPDPEVLADETRTMQDITQSALSERMDIL